MRADPKALRHAQALFFLFVCRAVVHGTEGGREREDWTSAKLKNASSMLNIRIVLGGLRGVQRKDVCERSVQTKHNCTISLSTKTTKKSRKYNILLEGRWGQDFPPKI